MPDVDTPPAGSGSVAEQLKKEEESGYAWIFILIIAIIFLILLAVGSFYAYRKYRKDPCDPAGSAETPKAEKSCETKKACQSVFETNWSPDGTGRGRVSSA